MALHREGGGAHYLPPMPRSLRSVAGAAILAILAASSLRAQAVHGRLLAADSTPVTGAIVSLVDTSGATIDRVLSSSIGSYTVRAPHEGRYLVRVLRIGFTAFASAPFELRAGAFADFTPVLPDTPIVLNDIEVSSGSGCGGDNAQAGTIATLLEEVRKAFGSVDLALRDRTLRFEVGHAVRRLDKNSMVTAQDSSTSIMSSWPVHSLPAEMLRDRGYVMSSDSVDASYLPYGVSSGRVWFGPDATTLFAESFLDTHCYQIQRDAHDPTRIGLGFAPVRGRRLPDISGTLWIQRGSLALRSLEYKYVNLPEQYRLARPGWSGGTMEFVRLPAGLWVVSRWQLRAPVEQLRDNYPVGVGGYLEDGGWIAHIRTTQGAVIY